MSDETLPTAAVLAHWRSGWFDMDWAETVAHVWAKQPERMTALAASIRETGIKEPILLGADGRIWDGHHRIAVACRQRIARLPVSFTVLGHHIEDGCPTCGLPMAVHHLWCPERPTEPLTAAQVMRQIHGVFADPSRAWFAPQFWDAFISMETP